MLNELPNEVLALSFEWLPTIKDCCSVRATCRKWGGSETQDGTSLDGSLRETLFTLNGETHFGTSYSPLFDHFSEPRPPYGSARPLRLFLCMCGDKLKELSLGLGANKGFKSVLIWLSTYCPNLQVLKLCDRFMELPYSHAGTPSELPQNFFLLGGGGFNHEAAEPEGQDLPAAAWYQLERLEFASRIRRHRHTLHWLAQSAAAPSLKHLSLTFDNSEELRDLGFVKGLAQLETLTLLHSSVTPFGKQVQGTSERVGSAWYTRPSGKQKHRISEELAHPLRGLAPPNLRSLNWGFSPDALFPLHLPDTMRAQQSNRAVGGRKKEVAVRQIEPEWIRKKREDELPMGFQVKYLPADFVPGLTSLTLRHRISGYVLRLIGEHCFSRLTSLNLMNCVPSDPESFILFLQSCRLSGSSTKPHLTARGPQLKELRLGLWITEIKQTHSMLEEVSYPLDPIAERLVEAFPGLEILNIGSDRPMVGNSWSSWGRNDWRGSREEFYASDARDCAARRDTLHDIIRAALLRCSRLHALYVPVQTKFGAIAEALQSRRNLETLGLHGINLESDSADAAAFKSFFSTESNQPILASLRELNLFQVRWEHDLLSVLHTMAVRCEGIRKLYLSAPQFQPGFFKRLGGPMLEVLHITLGPSHGLVYNEFLDAVQFRWPALTELCVSSEESDHLQNKSSREASSIYYDLRRRLKLCGRNASCQLSVGLLTGQEKATLDHDDYWDRYDSYGDDIHVGEVEEGNPEEVDGDDDWERSHSYDYAYEDYWYYDSDYYAEEADDHANCF